MNLARPDVPEPDYVRWFRDLGIDDLPLVGWKNASLGEMYRELAPKGVRVPNGFDVMCEIPNHRSWLLDLEGEALRLVQPRRVRKRTLEGWHEECKVPIRVS